MAESGIVQFSPAVRRTDAEDQRDDQHARHAQRDRADAGHWNGNHANQHAERDTEPDRDVAELGGAFDRVAEEAADFREVGAVGEDADTIAVLEHHVGPRLQIAVTAQDMSHDGPLVTWQGERTDWPADHARA